MKKRHKPSTKKAAANPQKAGWRSLRREGLEILQAGPLARLPWVVHGFTTRLGGQSSLDGKRVLNLSFTEWDSRAAVHANRKILLRALEAESMALVTLRQFHSDVVHHATQALGHSLRGDAHITQTPGLVLAIQTADCVPILLADAKRHAVAAIHAGWRSTLKRIVAKTLGRMRMHFGTQPADVAIALGPGIGPCCYEVGPEVVQQFASQFAHAAEWFEATPAGPHGKMATFDSLLNEDSPNPLKWLWMTPPGHDPPPPHLRLNLWAANRWQLLDAGVKPQNIVTSDLCTACHTDLFFSHRRERGRTGRLMGLIGIRP